MCHPRPLIIRKELLIQREHEICIMKFSNMGKGRNIASDLHLENRSTNNTFVKFGMEIAMKWNDIKIVYIKIEGDLLMNNVGRKDWQSVNWYVKPVMSVSCMEEEKLVSVNYVVTIKTC